MVLTSLCGNQLHKEPSVGSNYTNTHLTLIIFDHFGNTENDALGKFHERTCSVVDILIKSLTKKVKTASQKVL